MPVKRRLPKGRVQRITPEVIEAFQAKDVWRLHRVLGLDYAHYSPLLRSEVGGYGVPETPELPGERIILSTRSRALELRGEILDAIAEEKCRAG